LLVVKGQVSVDEFSGGFRMSAESLYSLDSAREAFATRLDLDVDAQLAANGFVQNLQKLLAPARPGLCPVFLRYRTDDAEAEVSLGPEWRIRPSGEVLDGLARLAGRERVHLVYP
jgi:DNA polymerase-3 subunit alpha